MASWNVHDNLIAHPGGGPGGTLVRGDISLFTIVAAANDSAQLEVSAVNAVIWLLNRGKFGLELFTNSSEPIALISGLSAVLVPPNYMGLLTCSVKGSWSINYFPIAV